ncbi:MAG: hypothetical protein P9M13_02015 [Candidatus Ancaeobacter aquaticus]|nr:hypothetical protein [Candidatus Ancaeobacter aquaticus]
MKITMFIVSTALFVFLATCGHAEVKENPWMKATKGSWAKHKNTTQTKVAGQAFNTENTTTTTLLDKDENGATLSIKTQMGSTKTENKMKVPATSDYSKMGMDVKIKEVGKETITVAGKSYDCTVSETILNFGGKETITTTWTCDKVPSGTVKAVTKNDMMNSTIELVEYEVK